MGLFENRRLENNKTQVPVWFMRQAGRYHSHYQNIKAKSDFMTMCLNPQLAEKITHGPIDDFNFDAAILFSDLLFPLDFLGMGLSYQSGPPSLKFHLNQLQDFEQLTPTGDAVQFFEFQGKACSLLRKSLPQDVSLLGFVGSPFTLYAYAVEGSHAGALRSAKMGLFDGRWEKFLDYLLPALLTEMRVQATGGADAVCLFDTAVGELTFEDFKEKIVPVIKDVCRNFKAEFPQKKIIYYSKRTEFRYLDALDCPGIDVLAIDWRLDLAEALKRYHGQYMIQGNIDPCWLHLPWEILEKKLAGFWENLQGKDLDLSQWICGLGHGVLIETPEVNVRKTVEYIHQNFTY